jgi:hypothetical protein
MDDDNDEGVRVDADDEGVDNDADDKDFEPSGSESDDPEDPEPVVDPKVLSSFLLFMGAMTRDRLKHLLSRFRGVTGFISER